MNPFKSKKAANVAPRELVDIQKEYQQLTLQSGQTQYLIFVKKEELKQFNARLIEINQEAAKRQELDAAKAKANEAAKEVKAE